MRPTQNYSVLMGGRLNPVFGMSAPIAFPDRFSTDSALEILSKRSATIGVIDGGRTSMKGAEIPVKNGEIDLSKLYYKTGKPNNSKFKITRYAIEGNSLNNRTFYEGAKWLTEHASRPIDALSVSVPGPVDYNGKKGIFTQARELGTISFEQVANETGKATTYDNDLKFWGYYVDFILRMYAEGKLPDNSPIITETIKTFFPSKNTQFGARQIVLAPGGGLNGAIVCGDYFVLDHEFGQSALPMAGKRIENFGKFLRKHYKERYKHSPTVTCEDGLSSRGLVDCLKFVYLEEFKKSIPKNWERIINKHGFNAATFIAEDSKQKDGIARKAFFLYLEIIGAVCANAVTTTGSTGGVWLGGSTRHDYDFMMEADVKPHFEQGYTGSRLIPQYYPEVKVIMDERAPNIGGAALTIGMLHNLQYTLKSK
jgi:hypothetical protein